MSTIRRPPQDATAFSDGNVAFLEEMYERYLRDPESVDPAWRHTFETMQHGASVVTARPAATPDLYQAMRKQTAVNRLINHYRARGHQAADNNPLKLAPPPVIRDLDPGSLGLTDADLDTLFYIDILASDKQAPLRLIIDHLKATYCGSIGCEYVHIVDTDIKTWIQHRMETTRGRVSVEPHRQRWLLQLLTAAEGIETYLHRKYVGQKRFSLEGGEALIPLLDELIQHAGSRGVREIVMGMAHRGRLNVLVNILGKPPSLLFREFEETGQLEPVPGGAGDVKYHLGFSSDVASAGGPVHLTMAFNPSHLESVNPVVEGSVRARQDRWGDDGETAVLGILIHGDAAFAGQGIVMETLNMAETRGYTTGGTIHIVINNQIGFTTSNPFDARSTLYCTDVANMIQAPVFHVNGDDPEAVLFVTRLALDFRMKFKRDVVIDLMCFRKHGHNEVDEPAVTQPLMYSFIRQHPGVRKLYADRLIEAGVVTADDVRQMEVDYLSQLDRGEIATRPTLRNASNYTRTRWDKYLGKVWDHPCDTRVERSRLQQIGRAMLRLPEDFTLHPRAAAIIDARREMAEGRQAADWGFAENLAYASLLVEGHNIRISGQDVGRGTFFHRHAILHDQQTGSQLIRLQHLAEQQGRFEIFDSLLSEEGVLGFEYGYTTTEPETLVIWEAQFGDFANNAQVIIDQFITSGETKWGRLSGLTMLLPHGYEGQGPEHSSARLERYLQLSAELNIQVCVPTTPAQMFHLLRRQLLRTFRKPLIALTPKSLLRHKLAVSTLDEMADSGFRTVIGEIDPIEPDKVTRVVLCTGKVYYDLLEARRRDQLENIAIIRIEQLYPFPRDDFAVELARYPNVEELVWCQEEPDNQGAWYQIRHRFLGFLSAGTTLRYAGRPMCAAPSEGQHSRHVASQRQLVAEALHGPDAAPGRAPH